MIILAFLFVESLQNGNATENSNVQALQPLTKEGKPIVIVSNTTNSTQNLNHTSESLVPENKKQEEQQKVEEKNETQKIETQIKENTDKKADSPNQLNETTNKTKDNNAKIVKQPNTTISSENSTTDQVKTQNSTQISKENTEINQNEKQKEPEQDNKNKIEETQNSKPEKEENTTKVEDIPQNDEKPDKKAESQISTNKNEIAVIESKEEVKEVEEKHPEPAKTKIIGQKVVIKKDGVEKIEKAEKEHKNEIKNENKRVPIVEVKNAGMNPAYKVIICGIILAIIGTAGYVAFKTISQSPRQATLEESVPFKFSMNQENDHNDLSKHGFSPL